MQDYDWQWAVDSPCWLKPRRTVYFILRCHNGQLEYQETPTGRIREWKTREAVISVLKKLQKRSEVAV